MNIGVRKLYCAIWLAGGAIALFLTLSGCFASIILDFRKPVELIFALSLVLPFPLFLIGFRSMRWSAALLWIAVAALWVARANIHPNPELNPIDALGTLYLCPPTAVQIAVFLARKKDSSIVAD